MAKTEKEPMNQGKKNDKSIVSFIKNNWILLLVLLYLISPIDFVPEVIIPAIGQTDDALLGILEIIRQWYKYKKDK